MKLSTALLRAVPGAFILNSGIGKLGLDEESAAGLQQMTKLSLSTDPSRKGHSPTFASCRSRIAELQCARLA